LGAVNSEISPVANLCAGVVLGDWVTAAELGLCTAFKLNNDPPFYFDPNAFVLKT